MLNPCPVGQIHRFLEPTFAVDVKNYEYLEGAKINIDLIL